MHPQACWKVQHDAPLYCGHWAGMNFCTWRHANTPAWGIAWVLGSVSPLPRWPAAPAGQQGGCRRPAARPLHVHPQPLPVVTPLSASGSPSSLPAYLSLQMDSSVSSVGQAGGPGVRGRVSAVQGGRQAQASIGAARWRGPSRSPLTVLAAGVVQSDVPVCSATGAPSAGGFAGARGVHRVTTAQQAMHVHASPLPLHSQGSAFICGAIDSSAFSSSCSMARWKVLQA